MMPRAMKKITMILAASAALLSGCVKEKISSNSNTSAGPGIRRIRGGAGEQRRVGVNIDRDAGEDTYYWKAGDAVILCGISDGAFMLPNYRFVLDESSVGAASGTFNLVGANIPAAGRYLAVHVNDETDLHIMSTGVFYSIPTLQQQSSGAADVTDYMLLAAPVTLTDDGTIPALTLNHKTAVVDLGITASDPALVGATLTGVSMTAETDEQYVRVISLSPAGNATSVAGRNANSVAVSDPAAVLNATTPYYVRMVTLMNAAAAGTVKFTVTTRSDAGDIYMSDVTKTSIDLIAGHVRPASIDLTSHAIGIYTAAQLDAVRNDLSSNYILMNDISLADYSAGEGWAPIGTDDTTPFTGKFNGNGHKITGLAINRPAEMYIGLFGYINSGSVCSLGVEVATAEINGGAYVGGIVGYVTYGTITYCYSTGNVTASNAGDAFAGGIVGRTGVCTITGCYSTGNISSIGGSSPSSGGIVGRMEGSFNGDTITGCHSTGNITSFASTNVSSSFAGGIAGVTNATITNCYSVGNIASSSTSGSYYYADSYSGGIAGGFLGPTISNCCSMGEISSSTSGCPSYSGGTSYTDGGFWENGATGQTISEMCRILQGFSDAGKHV